MASNGSRDGSGDGDGGLVGAGLPRVVIAAPASGHGKTTVATGLMAALAARGLAVSGHKVGPDFIDPGYHALATGRPGRNLDPFLVGEQRIVPLLLHGAAAADIAVIEGVMGLFDGRLGTRGEASTAHVSALTASPVILVMDISHASRTHAAVIAGLAAFDPGVRIAGVILNKARTERHADEVREALQDSDIPVLGVLPTNARVEKPSRHLGLVPAAERAESAATLEALAHTVARHVDLDAVLAIARAAGPLAGPAWDPAREVRASSHRRPVVAVAGGRAFTFRYAETEELLRAAGCEVIEFDPLTETALPADTCGIYLGGGFPEVHAAELAANTALLTQLRAAVAAGVPTVAECGGLLYLCRTLDGTPMVASLDADAAMTPRLTLGYRTATSPADSVLAAAGQQVTGHEFHRTQVTATHHGTGGVPHGAGDHGAAWEFASAVDGFAGPTLHAAYLHTHWAGHPTLAQRFADSVHEYAGRVERPRPHDLSHHGDAEATGGLVDFAVNVYPGPRPPWLESALQESLADAARYPDPTDARAALATRHGRPVDEVLPTAGASEAFALVTGLRNWRRPVVIHPQFTEPHDLLEKAGYAVTPVFCRPEDGFALHPDEVPEDADLVIVGNPTNPTGVLHPADAVAQLLRPGRVVVVDEAFIDAVPGEPEALADGHRWGHREGLLVTRSLTKQWSIPGIRAGYLVGDATLIRQAQRLQVPWSVSTPAIAAMLACSNPQAGAESGARATTLQAWKRELTEGLSERGIPFVTAPAPFVLARPGAGVHQALRDRGIAVRRADTFPGLDGTWIRIAARDPLTTGRLLSALDHIRPPAEHREVLHR